jgi:hypothetical protein
MSDSLKIHLQKFTHQIYLMRFYLIVGISAKYSIYQTCELRASVEFDHPFPRYVRIVFTEIRTNKSRQ